MTVACVLPSIYVACGFSHCCQESIGVSYCLMYNVAFPIVVRQLVAFPFFHR